ncbi:MAG: hypothetical protein AAF957_21475 [Planctomycetota bacterium]
MLFGTPAFAAGAGVLDTVFLGERVVLQQDDPLDWDGDGALDSNRRVELFRYYLPPPTVLADGTIYMNIRSNTAYDVLIRIDPPPPGESWAYCPAEPNSSGSSAHLDHAGSLVVAQQDLDVLAEDLPASSVTLLLTSISADRVPHVAGSQGTLCVGRRVGRFVQQVQLSTPSGTARFDVDLTGLPQPTGPVAAVPGETWRFQAWHRDRDAAGNPTSNLTGALAVVVE